MQKLFGVIPPVATPLTKDFKLDEASFVRVIERLLKAGMHGLFFLGSTGEVVFHDAATRKRILEIAVKTVNGKVPVLAGVIDPTTDRCIAHAKQAEAIGVDGLVLTAPFYTRTSQPEIGDHFRMVRDAVKTPIIAYDIPVCVHVKLDASVVFDLARDGTIIGLKDSSGDDVNIRRIVMDKDPNFAVFTGSELMVDTALAYGADGVVPGLGNVDPDGYIRLWKAAQARDWEAARREQERLIRLFDMVKVAQPRASAGAAGVGAFKASLQLLGVFETNLMARPQRSLNREETERVGEILKGAGLLG